ncbi:hypothetical protein PBY51_016527 [Eleginops maclovinus]|uniref:Uncharacterized protein n=1 Tax=Eleginops maclovinus TaxID=56733 RepID=A0AAN7W6U2_ELEMC|nr:hypothetical protein PBY51_016527 [Eleginops maclovinus]
MESGRVGRTVLWMLGVLMLMLGGTILTDTDGSPDGTLDLEDPGSGSLHKAMELDQFLYRRPVALSRRKRNILFPNGVRLCSQETYEQAVANHQNYFHLRGTILENPEENQ